MSRLILNAHVKPSTITTWQPFFGFSQRTNTKQLNKDINALLRIDKKQDKMIEKLDETRIDIVQEIRWSKDTIIKELGSEIRGQKIGLS